MKKKICSIICIIFICISCFGLGYWYNNKTNNEENNKEIEAESNNEKEPNEEFIKMPDRIIFKYNSKYYEITPDYEKYSELVSLCKNNLNKEENKEITETDINSLKANAKFIEFDYNTISKNFIFTLTSDIGVIQMKENDGIIISSKLSNIDKIVEAYIEAIKNSEGYDMNSENIESMKQYLKLPSEIDFKKVKDEKVFVKVINSYDDFYKISTQYNLKFDNADNIKEKFENKKGILILSKYDVKDYKVNIGNVKINFSGNDYAVPTYAQAGYNADLILVSKIVNTNCIYYNYDDIKFIDNLTGTTEIISGVVKSKNADEITISYTTNSNSKVIGKVMLSSRKLINKTADEVKEGDYISGTAIVTGVEDGIKLYDAESIFIQDKDEYNKLLEKNLKGKSAINTSIVNYYQSESGYDGYVTCALYYGENSIEPDAYFEAYYDFYDNKTESYLGTKERSIASNYGIHPHEIVDITFAEPITDINKINVKIFEYIAD